jgi:hypothetical protein
MSAIRASRLLLLLAVAALFATTSRADTYSWQNFQSDIAGVAAHVDPNLVNPWGLTASAGGTIWASDNGAGVATLYRQDGTAVSLVVTIPGREGHKPGTPTGTIVNSTPFFKVTKNGNSQPARFLFVSEDGTISGWNPTLDPTNAIIAVKGKGDNRVEALRLADAFRARVIDASTESFVFEITGKSDKIEQFVALMLPLGLVEVSRTGVVAISRGAEGM